MTSFDRRKLLQLGGTAAVGSVAGCFGSPQSGDETETDATTTEATTTTAEPASEAEGPPGGDQLGGPDDLQSSAEVDATVLDNDQGAGQYVNTPAIVWLESGATVTWNIKEGNHSVTAYHPEYDKQRRIPEDAEPFDSGVLSAGETFEHTFETAGVYNYYCRPHEGLGMVGVVLVEEPRGGPGTTDPSEIESSTAAERVGSLLDTAGIDVSQARTAYEWQDATWDTYWYSLYNMSTNISMSGNGVQFPHNEQQQEAFDRRVPAMLEYSDVDQPPIKNPNLNMAPFTKGDPSFTEEPVFDAGDGRPDASTLKWDIKKSSKTVSPASVAWTHLKGVTWAKNFEAHFDALPEGMAPKFRAQMLTTLAQIGIRAALIAGGPEENGALTKGDSLELVSGFNPVEGELVDETSRPRHHAAMLWFLSDLMSLAENEWYGYVNPEPLIPAEKLRELTDGMADTTMDLFGPDDMNSRELGLMLGALGWYGTHPGSEDLRSSAADYANELADALESNVTDAGKVENGAQNQAATQGIVTQGLVWASQVEGVDRAGLAENVAGYLVENLWDEEVGVFTSAEGDSTYTFTGRDAADLTGGLNCADAELELDGTKERFATCFNELFNRARLQRAERPPSHDGNAEYPLPLPPKAGGEFGQAAVYNTEIQYDTESDTWRVTDDTFDCEQALYLANQDIWVSHWGGEFFQGRGVPGKSDEPPQ
ncbi:plasmid stabilization protein [Halobacteriales archaeon QS_1_67_19]|nr:MAG: plasmid stabilization protein [Halobacteriales archaeon QS_1_67_19]